MVKGFLHGRVDLTSSLCCLAACPVCAPPLDFTHRLHFCRFHPRCCSVYSASAAATGGREGEIGSRLSINLHPAPSSQQLTRPPSPSSSITSSSVKPSPICLSPTLIPSSLSKCFNSLTIRLTSWPNSGRTHERSRPSSDPSGVALRTAGRDTVTSHSCSRLRLRRATRHTGEPTCHALAATSLAAPRSRHSVVIS